MGVRVRRVPPVTERDIVAAESQLGVGIPETYRTFLKATNGGQAVDGHFSNMVGVQAFLGLGDMVNNHKALHDRIPADMVPIATAEGGNSVLIDGRGAVYFWDHELEESNTAVQKLASSFDEFAVALKPRPVSSGPRPQGQMTVRN